MAHGTRALPRYVFICAIAASLSLIAAFLSLIFDGRQYSTEELLRRGSLAVSGNVGERMQATMAAANSKGLRQGDAGSQNVFASLNLPLQKVQKSRMGSTAAVSGTRLGTTDHSMLSHQQQQSTTQRGYGKR